MRSWMWVALIGCGSSVGGDGGPGTTVPLYGGTLAVDDGLVVVADPLRDFVAFATGPVVRKAPLAQGSEPFRVAVTPTRAFVTLRGTGEVVAFNRDANEMDRAWVCDAPRGIDEADGVLFVACAGGELVELTPDLRVLRSSLHIPDLRDVVVDEDTVYVSVMRHASVLRLDRETGALVDVARPELDEAQRVEATPRVARRMVAHPLGGALMLHQAHSDRQVDLILSRDRDDRGAYGSSERSCGAPAGAAAPVLVSWHVSRIRPHSVTTGGSLVMTQALDVVVDPETRNVYVAGYLSQSGAVGWWSSDSIEEPGCPEPIDIGTGSGALITSVGAMSGRVVTYDRQLGVLAVGTLRHALANDADVPTEPEASQLFHADTGAGIACQSCHPEGQDDGHTWVFQGLGPRRTQNLAGGVTSRGRLHWAAEYASLGDLMDDVFVDRMSGSRLAANQVVALGAWLDGIAPVRATSDASSGTLDRGRRLFDDPQVGCGTCHTGPQLSDHQTHVVATGADVRKTPSLLGVGTRAPYMSNGCAPTVLARLTDETCGGDQHGDLSGLDQADLEALADFVGTL